MNTEITKGSLSYVISTTKEAEDEGIIALVKGDNNDGADAQSVTRSRPSVVLCTKSASDSHNSNSELQNDYHDSAQSTQSSPAVASLKPSDLTNNALPRHCRRSDALNTNNLEGPHTVALFVAPSQE